MAELIGASLGCVPLGKRREEISDWVMKAYRAAFHVPETYFFRTWGRKPERNKGDQTVCRAVPSTGPEKNGRADASVFSAADAAETGTIPGELANDAKSEEIEE